MDSVSSVAVFPVSRQLRPVGLASAADGGLYLLHLDAESSSPSRLIEGFSGIAAVAALGKRSVYEAVVATRKGDLIHLRIGDRKVRQKHIAGFRDVADIAGASVPDSDDDLLLVALTDGSLHELRLRGHRIVTRRDLGVKHVTRIAAFADAGESFYGVAATADGKVLTLRLGECVTQELVARIRGVRDVAGFLSEDGLLHVVAATAAGQLIEVSGSALLGRRQVILRAPGDAARLAATYDLRLRQPRLLLATVTGALHSLGWADPFNVGSRLLTQLGRSEAWVGDVSPDTSPDPSDVEYSSAGLMLAIDGGPYRLYAVSMNAGLWTSIEGQSWFQLPSSPPSSYCVAVDPANDLHVVVGERSGDVKGRPSGTTGLWESTDGGYSWEMLDLNPPGDCSVSAIPCVFFSRASTLYVGTACGVGRRRVTDPQCVFVANPGNLARTPCTNPGTEIPEGITAFAESLTTGGVLRVWARTATKILFSDDDGTNWTVVDIQSNVDGYGTTETAYRNCDFFSLAAFGNSACILFKPDTCTDPRVHSPTDNTSTLLIYNEITKTFRVQRLPANDGTGAGGRRLVKSYLFANRLPGFTSALFFSDAQAVFRGNIGIDGTVTWDTSPLGGSPVEPGFQDFHGDLWDFHASSDGHIWIAGDGGIFRRDPGNSQWMPQNASLHTQTVTGIAAVPSAQSGGPDIAYTTHDNGAWSRRAGATSWQVIDFGDAGIAAGDAAVPDLALLIRHRESAAITTFGAPPPPDSRFTPGEIFPLDFYKEEITAQGPVDLPTSFASPGGMDPITLQIIQTPFGQTPKPLLDVVMLADLPLTRWDGAHNVPFHPDQPLGNPNPGGNPVLIRSSQWAASPHATDGFDQTYWQLEDGNMPTGTFGFWVSGGHNDPVYYACANKNAPLLFRRTSMASTWQPVISFNGNLVPGGQTGPVFVNPYNRGHLYILTDQGVQYSINGDDPKNSPTFNADIVLTSLISDMDRFGIAQLQFDDVFDGGNFKQVVNAEGYFSIEAGCLAHMAFLRDNPTEVIAVSPFTGVFYNRDALAGGNWEDLTFLLPSPAPRCLSSAITRDAIYLGTCGRGILRIENYQTAAEDPGATISVTNLDDCGVGPPRGAIALFAVSTRGLTAPLSYTWAVTGGTQAETQPPQHYRFAVQLPDSPALVTVRVKVTDRDMRTVNSSLDYSPPTALGRLVRDLVCHEQRWPLYPWQYRLPGPDPGPEVLAQIRRDVAETVELAAAMTAIGEALTAELAHHQTPRLSGGADPST